MTKYRNRKVGGYASAREARRAADLKLLEQTGYIMDLREQVEFELIPKQNGERSVRYVADFVYRDYDGNHVVEDVKGIRTPAYIIKRKLMLFRLGIKVKEV